MEDMKNLKSIQHNNLIEGTVKMNRNPLKFFELAVASIDTDTALKSRDYTGNNIVKFDKNIVFKLFENEREDHLKDQMNSLMNSTAFEVAKEYGDLGDSLETKLINAVAQIRWLSNENTIELTFTPQIMPYLINLKENGLYTQYKLENIAKMESKYSIVLFKWLISNFNQYIYYQKKQNRSKDQLSEYKNPKIKISDLRKITDTKSKYSSFPDFEKRVLKIAVDEINEYTDYEVTYEKIKRGRTYSDIQFFINEKPKKFVAPLTEEELSPEEQEKETLLLAAEARKSKYTKILSETGLILFDDAMSDKYMARVQLELIPLLEKFENSQGTNELEKHLKYVASKSGNKNKIDKLAYQTQSTKNEMKKRNII